MKTLNKSLERDGSYLAAPQFIVSNTAIMKLSINTSVVDWSMESFEKAVRPHLDALEKELSSDYSGIMENLWIDLELCPPFTESHKPYRFRFQKKVSMSPPKGLGLEVFQLDKEYEYNVGHYSVMPDYEAIRSMPEEDVPFYLLRILYSSTAVLLEKKKRLQGFDAERFREDFASCCKRLGCTIDTAN